MESNRYKPVLYALAAALLYGISSPASKRLLADISPTFMAALLYLGAGIGMSFIKIIGQSGRKKVREAKITKKELPYVLGMIGLDIAAPIFLMIGLSMTTAANASLLSNFEIVATSIIAFLIFKESIGRRLWLALGLIALASILLSIEDASSFAFSSGSFFVLLGSICWGCENNCTRMLSSKDPTEIVIVKGFGSGIGSLVIAFFTYQTAGSAGYILFALGLGFVSYGLSIYFYVLAQRELGAARTSAFYAVSPFIGTGLSVVFLRETPTIFYLIALLIMAMGVYFTLNERHEHMHIHPVVIHEHRHNHMDEHHNHVHSEPVIGEHSHVHSHEQITHSHSHTPDIHHTHMH
jgi:Permeases of the drug/metabolite transporter (DMT) superfamily